MRIAVYDTQHEETLSTIIRIFDDGQNELHIFTTPEMGSAMQKRFTSNSIHWHLIVANTALDFPAAITRQNRKYQYAYILLSTVHKHHLLFAFFGKSTSKLLVVVHDSFILKPRLRFGIRAGVRYAGMRLLNTITDGFVVLSSEVKKHIEKEKLTRKPVIVMPGAVWQQKGDASGAGDFIIAVPGTAERTRRDYEELVQLAPLLSPVSRKVQFILLGKADERSYIPPIADKINTSFPSVEVTLFSSYISTELFEEWLCRSHVVYLPLRKKTKRPEGDEYYGKTKISGGFYDAVKFSRIILHPSFIPVAAELKDQTVTYSSVEELAAWINSAVSDPGFLRSAQEKADKNAERFQLEKVRKSFLTQLQSHK